MNINKNFSHLIEQTNLTRHEVSEFLGVSLSTIEKWCAGETVPNENHSKQLSDLAEKIAANNKLKGARKPDFTFIDLFAGIGGIRIPFQEIGGECVFTSEIDKYAKKTYANNFGEIPHGDITQIAAKDIPQHDVLLAGFPCQAFSQAGLKQGFMDTRGTMFFEIQRILSHHRPKAFLLENVKQLRGHDKGRTLKTIVDILQGNTIPEIPDDIPMSEEARNSLGDKLNYWVDFKVLRATDYGVPQNRERIYIVGFDRDYFKNLDFIFKWPEPSNKKTSLGDILFSNNLVEDKYTISDKLWEGHQRRKMEHKNKGNGFGYGLFNHKSPYANTISARYYKDGSEVLIDQSDIGKNPRKLTPRECARLQGFPDDFILNGTSDSQAYKQFGNSVAVPVIRHVALAMQQIINMRVEQKKAA